MAELDLTNEHLHTLEGVELDPALQVCKTSQRMQRCGCHLAQPTTAPAPLPLLSTAVLISFVQTIPGFLVQTLDLTANRLRHLEPALLALTGLRRLCLRQNLVSDVGEVAALASAPGVNPGQSSCW